MNEQLDIFIDSTHAKLDGVELGLLGMTHGSTPDEALAAHRRSAYRTQERSRAAEIATVERFTDVLENLLNQLRGGHIDTTPELIGLILAGCDHVRALLDHMSQQHGGDLLASLTLESRDVQAEAEGACHG